MSINKKQLISIAIHVLIWVAIAVLPILFKPSEVTFNSFQLQGIYVHLAITILVFYLCYSVIIPLLFYKKKIIPTLILIIAISAVASVSLSYTKDKVVHRRMLKSPENQPGPIMKMHNEMAKKSEKMPRRYARRMYPGGILFDNFFFFLLISGAALSIRATQKWMLEEQDRKSLEVEKATIELAWLKNQVSPHFFFNTLNNIHSLIESNPSFAQKSVHKLSKLMRYLLYESNATLITLSKEIAFIENYMGLMKLKLTDKVKVSFNYPAIPANISIPPLLFNPLIENAFKFGVSYQEESFIKIELEIEDKKITLMVENSISKNHPLQEQLGIGLANLRQRLDLLYTKNYDLQVEEDSDTYKVKLEIPIDES